MTATGALGDGGATAVWAVVVAGGQGRRFGAPKQFEDLGGRPVVAWALAAARAACDGVVLVVPRRRDRFDVDSTSESRRDRFDVDSTSESRRDRFDVDSTSEVDGDGWDADAVVEGGATRSESVRAGLAAVPRDAGVVLVHDAARPFASAALFAAVIDAVRAGAAGVIPGVPVRDTLKRVGDDAVVAGTVDRNGLVAVQTPQGFDAAVLRRAHEGGGEATDDAALVEAIGGKVVVVPGEDTNFKITQPDDLVVARALVAGRLP